MLPIIVFTTTRLAERSDVLFSVADLRMMMMVGGGGCKGAIAHSHWLEV